MLNWMAKSMRDQPNDIFLEINIQCLLSGQKCIWAKMRSRNLTDLPICHPPSSFLSHPKPAKELLKGATKYFFEIP